MKADFNWISLFYEKEEAQASSFFCMSGMVKKIILIFDAKCMRTSDSLTLSEAITIKVQV
jgi:hypothetical protein